MWKLIEYFKSLFQLGVCSFRSKIWWGEIKVNLYFKLNVNYWN